MEKVWPVQDSSVLYALPKSPLPATLHKAVLLRTSGGEGGALLCVLQLEGISIGLTTRLDYKSSLLFCYLLYHIMYVQTEGLYVKAVEVQGKTTDDTQREDEIAVYRAAIRILRQQKLDLQYKVQSLLKTIALMQQQLAVPGSKDSQGQNERLMKCK